MVRKEPGDQCPYCYKVLTKAVFKEKNRRRVENIKRSLKESDCAGRPRKYDYDQIIKLRSLGLTYAEIAAELGCSTYTAHRAAKEDQND